LKLVSICCFLFLNLICLHSNAQTINIVNIQSLIDNNLNFISILKEIDRKKEKYFENFKIIENKLKTELEDIENSKHILSENEMNIKIKDYNNQFNDFSKNVENFNIHYQNQIINIREKIFFEIIKLLENYAKVNNIDLILDSTSYLIASNAIDITQNIDKELKKINLNLEYKDFENN